MPSLPALKGKPCRPFEIIGSDYFVPISLRLEENEKTATKRWVCIFTCLVTRNIHLEVVHDMTTTNFLKILKFEEFRLLMYEIAAIVNSRPLTYVYDKVSTTTIRPMDFLRMVVQLVLHQ